LEINSVFKTYRLNNSDVNNQKEEFMKILDSLNIHENKIAKTNHKAKIDREAKALRLLKTNVKYCNKNIKRQYRTIGKHFADCLFDEEIYSDDIDIDTNMALILSNQNAISATYELMKIFEESHIRNLIIQDRVEFEIGLESTIAKLQEQLSRGEIGVLDYEYESFNAKRWFDNYDKITEIRMKKLENKISLEEMNTEIINLLGVEYL